MQLFGLTLDRRVNLLALAAFVMSLASIGLQIWHYVEGAKVELRVGERVNLIFESHAAQRDNLVLHINARLSYINSGAVGRDAMIVGERVEIALGDLPPYEYRWHHFETFTAGENGIAEPRFADTAHDFGVPGADTATHQTTFVAFPEVRPRNPNAETDYLTKVDLLRRIIRSSSTVTLTFIAEGVGVTPDPVSCRLLVTERIVDEINATNWVTVFCEEIDGSP